MAGGKNAAIVVAVLGVAGVLAPGALAQERVEVPLESCTQAEADAHGRAEYRNDSGRERLRFDIDDTTAGLIGATLDVFVDDEFMGSMEVEEDEQEAGRGEGTLRFDSDDGDALPATLDGDETVDIRRDDASDEPNGERLVSSECDGFDDSPRSGDPPGGGSGGGSPGGGLDGLLQTLLGVLGLAP